MSTSDQNYYTHLSSTQYTQYTQSTQEWEQRLSDLNRSFDSEGTPTKDRFQLYKD